MNTYSQKPSSLARRSIAAAALVTVSTGLALSGAPSASAAPAAPAAPAKPAAPRAAAHDVSVTVRPTPDHSSGNAYVDLVYTNVSRHAVRIYGYAGVSVVAHHNGTQVGRPAIWLRNRRASTVVLKPGQRTTEIISIADAGNFGRGRTVTADGFRVYLPESRAAIFVPYRFRATTRNVSQLQADPIGARI